jgi:formyltetrahydrofolate deformylase
MSLILTISCADTVGIVAAVSGFLADQGGFILESAHFGDADSDRFFMRTVFKGARPDFRSLEDLRAAFTPLAASFGMDWAIDDADRRAKVVIAVSKFGHCLHDLLYRWQIGTLPVDIVGVISNHDDMRALVEWHKIPYHYLPAPNEAAFMDIAQAADLVVLARYMQILSDDMARALAGKCINIHHSFLPSFKGAKPYHQAFARGVKIIGATAHYVTGALDEGPIIEQEVARVDHTATPDRLIAVGRDIEAIVLARAVQWHVERRVLMNGDKTVVFR